jgi:hypothetical protein
MEPIRFMTSCRCNDASFANRTMEGFGKPQAAKSPDGIINSSEARLAGTWEEIAATSTSALATFKASEETTKAGRCLVLLKSVKGK